MEHQWILAPLKMSASCCKICGIVQRRDGMNAPCKGPYKITLRQVARAKEELVEMDEAFSVGGGYTDEHKAKEVADVIICLYRVMVDLGHAEAIDEKMAINRQRTWNVRPDGTAYHVKSTTTEGA